MAESTLFCNAIIYETVRTIVVNFYMYHYCVDLQRFVYMSRHEHAVFNGKNSHDLDIDLTRPYLILVVFNFKNSLIFKLSDKTMPDFGT